MTYSIMPEPSQMQARVLAFFQNYTRDHGRSPSLADAALFMGRSTPTVISHLNALVRKGFLVPGTPGAPRNLTLTEKGKAYGCEEERSPATHDE
jgi:SOS-response transcriptional repressor LexA